MQSKRLQALWAYYASQESFAAYLASHRGASHLTSSRGASPIVGYWKHHNAACDAIRALAAENRRCGVDQCLGMLPLD